MTRMHPALFLAFAACRVVEHAADTSGSLSTNTNDTAALAVDTDGDGYSTEEDCNDTDAAVHPGAREICNGIDDDCDEAVDDADFSLDPGAQGWVDADGDGAVGTWGHSCVTDVIPTDCDDSDAAVHPGSPEDQCNDIDDNCDGIGIGPWPPAALRGRAYESIQAAIDDADDGDEVRVCPGIHTERLEIGRDRTIDLVGSTGDPADVVLDGGHQSDILFMDFYASSRLSGLTFQAGVARYYPYGMNDYWGGAIVAVMPPTLLIEDCVFRDNEALTGGGAVFVDSANWTGGGPIIPVSLRIERTVFDDNRTPDEGSAAAAVDVDAYTEADVTVAIVETTFDGNTGGAALAVPGKGRREITVEDSIFRNNSVYTGSVNTGAWFAEGGWTILGTEFTDNMAAYGPAITTEHLNSPMEVILTDCSIARNASSTPGNCAVMMGDRADVLVSDGTDWGTEGPEDNAWCDVYTWHMSWESHIVPGKSWDGIASFRCDSETDCE